MLAQRNGDAPSLSLQVVQNEAPTSHYAVPGERRRDALMVLPPEHAIVYTTLRTNERNEGNTTGNMSIHVYNQQLVKNEPILLTVCAAIYSMIQMVTWLHPFLTDFLKIWKLKTMFHLPCLQRNIHRFLIVSNVSHFLHMLRCTQVCCHVSVLSLNVNVLIVIV